MPYKKKTAKTWKGNTAALEINAEMPQQKIKGSPQQEAVWSAIKDQDGHLVVEARAGTGKTFTMLHGLNLLGGSDSTAFMAYNKAIAEELQSKVPNGVVACTTHSHGLKAIREAGMSGKINGWKTWNLIEENYGGREKAKKEDQVKLMAIEKLTSLLKATLSGGVVDGIYTVSTQEMQVIIDRFSIDCGNKPTEVMEQAVNVVNQSIEIFQDKHEIDFDDMIWLPVVLGFRIPKYENVIVDEAQDLNRNRQELILRSVSKGGRILIVGDRRQAIYGFTGADMQSIPNMTERLKGSEVFPLTISRRCPKSHVLLAQHLVPDFTAMDNAIEGELGIIHQRDTQKFFSGGEMVLCRVNAPLICGALQCIAAGKRATIQGKDFGKYLKAFITRFKADRVVDLLNEVNDFADEERAKFEAYKSRDLAEKKVAELDDKVAAIYALCEGEKMTDKVVEKVDTLFSEVSVAKENVTTFSSIHRSKGLEASKIVVMQPEIMQHPMAKKPEDKEQEENVCYVGLTRSTRSMQFVVTDKTQGLSIEQLVFGK